MCHNDELSSTMSWVGCLLTERLGITDVLRRIWLFSINKIKSSESASKQPTQLIIVAYNCHNYMQWQPNTHI